jgi:DNA mismatch repair protein MutS2
MKRIREKRDQILLRVEERGTGLFRQTERELGRLVQSLSPPEPGKKKPRRELREIENRFRSQVKRQRKKRSRIQNLRPGEWVRVLDLNREGTVGEVQESIDMVEVLVGQFKIKTSLRNVERVAGREPASKITPAPLSIVSSSGDATGEINVIGLTIDEALPEVDKLIDRALVENLDSVTIIHGSGTGRLREAIRNYLKKHRAVTGFGSGDPQKGGLGVTVAKLGGEREVGANERQEEQPNTGSGSSRR